MKLRSGFVSNSSSSSFIIAKSFMTKEQMEDLHDFVKKCCEDTVPEKYRGEEGPFKLDGDEGDYGFYFNDNDNNYIACGGDMFLVGVPLQKLGEMGLINVTYIGDR